MKKVAVIDYGMSNLHSVSRACEHVADNDWQVVVSNQAEEIYAADKVVFPGQGAIGNCMQLLDETGLAQVIQESLQNKPFLGICLGLQTLLHHSEESGGVKGFAAVPGTVRHFAEDLRDPNSGEHLKIPHMGWSQVKQQQAHPLWEGIEDNSRFYFVHSYYADPDEARYTAATTDYPNAFTAAIAYDNVFAVQFHPEKSQHDGLRLLQNFLNWNI